MNPKLIEHKRHYSGLLFSNCPFCFLLVQWGRGYERKTAEHRKSRGYPDHLMRPLEHMKMATPAKS